MHQEILINVEPQEKRVAIIEDRNLEEFYVERQGLKRLPGNIYKGKVEAVIPAIGAAFVNIGLKKNGFLYVQDLIQPDYERMAEHVDKPYTYEGQNSDVNGRKAQVDIKQILKAGQEILVQITKEPLSTKGARLSTHISLPGRYLVLLPGDKHLGISRRIQDNKERERLRKLLKSLTVPPRMGLIVRTVGFAGTKREFLQDLRYLINLWRRIKGAAQRKGAPALVYEDYDLALRVIRDKFSSRTNRLLVDTKDEYKRIMHFLGVFSPNLRPRVQFYRQPEALFVKRGVEDEISRIYERKVSLKSGGYIMIEPTEGLVAIDVNSARFTDRKDPEETAYLVNLEAAREIARQLRLRDIGGIIVIDFIDMKSAKHRKQVFAALSEALRRDYAKTDITSISELGLIEMTRQRTRKSLESVTYQSCPYCQGKGLVRSAATMAILALREINKRLQKVASPRPWVQLRGKKTLFVFTHPNVATWLVNENRQSIVKLENRFRVKILIKQDPKLHMERFRIENA